MARSSIINLPARKRRTKGGSMNLETFIDEYTRSRDLSAGYVDQLRWLASALAKTHGRAIDTGDLTPDLINAHLQDCRARGLSDETRRSRRRMFLSIAEAAVDAGVTPPFARRHVMKIRRSQRVVSAWTPEQVSRLLRKAEAMSGMHQNGVTRAAYWASYVRFGWDTGLRGVDIRSIHRDDLMEGDEFKTSFVVVQNKTAKPVRHHLREATIEAMRRLPVRRGPLWGLWGRIENWRREAAELVAAADLVGGIGRLRHSSGTAVESIARGRGHEHLGNTRQVFERHYLDADQLPDNRPLPPEI